MATQTTENYQMIREVYDTYQARLREALASRAELERKLSRLNHEVRRIENHIGRMEDFCSSHEIDLIQKEGEK